MSLISSCCLFFFFFLNDPPPPEISPLPLPAALPINPGERAPPADPDEDGDHRRGTEEEERGSDALADFRTHRPRSEEHTSELQSRLHLVCRLLLEKKKKTQLVTE